MTKTTTLRVSDQTDADIRRVQAEIGAATWAAAINYILRRGIVTHDAETPPGMSQRGPEAVR